MRDQDIKQIEQYLRGELPAAARELFEARLEAEPALREELEIHRQAQDWITREGRGYLKQLLVRERQHLQRKQRLKRRYYLGGLGLLLLLVLVAFYLLRDHSSNSRDSVPIQPPAELQDSMPDMARQRDPAPDSPTLKQPSPGTEPMDRQASEPNAAEIEALYAAHFEPLQEEGLGLDLRGSDSLDLLQRFQQAYTAGQFSRALQYYEQLSAELRQNDNLRLQEAISRMALGQHVRASRLLESIIRNDQTRYMDAARWYYALTVLKTRPWPQARSLFSSIAKDASSPYSQDAQEMLKLE